MRELASRRQPPSIYSGTKQVYCAGMYVVSQAGARKVLEHALPVRDAIDHWPPTLRVLRYEQPLAQQVRLTLPLTGSNLQLPRTE